MRSDRDCARDKSNKLLEAEGVCNACRQRCGSQKLGDALRIYLSASCETMLRHAFSHITLKGENS